MYKDSGLFYVGCFFVFLRTEFGLLLILILVPELSNGKVELARSSIVAMLGNFIRRVHLAGLPAAALHARSGRELKSVAPRASSLTLESHYQFALTVRRICNKNAIAPTAPLLRGGAAVEPRCGDDVGESWSCSPLAAELEIGESRTVTTP
jgi:hypothetical protein